MSDAARRTGFLAGLAGLICVALITSAGAQAPDLAARCCLIAGALFFARDVIEGSGPMLGQRMAMNVVRWFHALHLACLASALLHIFAWQGPESFAVSSPLILLSAALGLLIAFLRSGTRFKTPVSPPFDLARPAIATLLGRLVYFGWPLLACTLIFLSARHAPNGGWVGVFPLFQMCFVPFLVPLFSVAGGWTDRMPRLFGFALLLSGLVL